MPLLEEVIRVVMKQNRTRLSIQPKQDIVDEVMALIRKLGAEQWIGFNEGSFARVARVKELSPKVHVFYDTDGIDTKLHVERARKHGFESIVMYHENITKEDVKMVQDAGIEAGAWTVNDPEEMKRLLELGIDRLYTDYPSRLNNSQATGKPETDGVFKAPRRGTLRRPRKEKGRVYCSGRATCHGTLSGRSDRRCGRIGPR
jgi:glycerophosphoryl diester phosphodiesterase